MRHALVYFVLTGLALAAHRTFAADKPATQPVTTPSGEPRSPAVQEAARGYQAAMAQAARDRNEQIQQAWLAIDQRLETILADTMKRGDLEDANRIAALRAGLKAEHLGTTRPARATEPKSAAALGARIELSRNVARIHAEHARTVDKHNRDYLEALDGAIKATLKAGDLEEANRIAALRKKIQAVPAAAPGRFPPGAVLAFSMDRDTYFKKDNKELVRDLSGNDNHGVVTEGTGVAGRTGQAVAFTGPGSHLVTLKPVGIKDDQPRTLALWVKFGRVPHGHWRHFAGWGEGQAARRHFRMSLFDGKFLIWSYGNGNDWNIGRAVEPRTWQHHAIIYDGKEVRWFINGEAFPHAFPIIYHTADSAMTLGNCDVAFDEVVLYNRVLSNQEILQLVSRPREP